MTVLMPRPTTPPTTAPSHDCTDLPVPPRSEWYEAYHCPKCDETTVNTGYALYECIENGNCFVLATSANSNNQCPVCFKFARQISDHACYLCEQAEADVVWVFDCPICQDLVLAPNQGNDNA